MIYIWYIYVCVWFVYMVYIYTMFYSWYISIYTCVCGDIISVPLGRSWLNFFFLWNIQNFPDEATHPSRWPCKQTMRFGQWWGALLPPDPRMILVDVDSPIKVVARLPTAPAGWSHNCSQAIKLYIYMRINDIFVRLTFLTVLTPNFCRSWTWVNLRVAGGFLTSNVTPKNLP